MLGEGKKLSANDLDEINSRKTGALLTAACLMGVAAAGGTDAQEEAAARYGAALGMAFQIRDDILDIEGDEHVLGKPVGSDEKNEKVTYVSYYGLEKAKKKVEELSEEAEKILQEIAGRDSFLIPLTMWLIDREK